MSGQFMTPPRIRGTSVAQLLNRVGGIVMVAVGLVALVIGVTQSVSRTWPTATGWVQSCETGRSHTGNGRNSRTNYYQKCIVNWMDGARQRTTSIDFNNTSYGPGASVQLRVHGGRAVLDTQPWMTYLVGGVGLVLVAGGVFLVVRSRSRHSDAPLA